MRTHGITLFYIFIGAGLGGLLRHGLVTIVNRVSCAGGCYPLGTTIVNLVGCFVAGLVLFFVLEKSPSQSAMLFLITGLLGGFTTFSAFSIETFLFLQKSQMHLALYNVILTMSSIGMTYVGYLLARWL